MALYNCFYFISQNSKNIVSYNYRKFCKKVYNLYCFYFCTFISIRLEANQKDYTHKSIGNTILICISVSIILIIFYILCVEPILTIFG